MAIRVYIGTEAPQWLPTEVLKHSARRRSRSDIEFHELKNIPLKLKFKMYTGFSFYRFSIPEACHFEGRALYLDADIMVLSDLKDLIEKEMRGKGVLARPCPPVSYFTSVMLLDCARLTSWKIHDWVTMINANVTSYPGTMSGEPTGLSYRDMGPLEEYWNHLDHWDETTRIIHYTHVPTQPWKVPGHKHADIFLRELRQSLEDKVVTRADVEREIKAGYIYPDILKDVEKVDVNP
jgi:Glycosyl transferase family 8